MSRNAYATQDFSPGYLRTALEGSLRRLGTDHIDLYQLHGPRIVADDDTLAVMQDFVAEGKILGVGVGLESLEHAGDWLETGALSSIQVPFGVLDPEARTAIIPKATELGVRVIVRGVFAGGHVPQALEVGSTQLGHGQAERLAAVGALASAAGVDVLQIAAWFVASHAGVSTVLVGTSSLQHLREGVRYLATAPPLELVAALDALCAS